MDDGEKIEKVLGEPVLEEFSAHNLAIRRNLMLVSFIAIIIVTYDLAITGQFVGINIQGLDKAVMSEIFFLLVAYHLIHFIWATWDHVQHWRVRITGTRLAHQTGSKWASLDADYPADPKQSSLYHWWHNQVHQIGNISASMVALGEKVEGWEQKIKEAGDESVQVNLNNVTQSLGQITSAISSLKPQVEAAEKTISSQRIPVSLERFDKWFFRFQKSQLARWFFVEWLFPIILGVWAFCLTWPF